MTDNYLQWVIRCVNMFVNMTSNGMDVGVNSSDTEWQRYNIGSTKATAVVDLVKVASQLYRRIF
jgi:hypothetical protein